MKRYFAETGRGLNDEQIAAIIDGGKIINVEVHRKYLGEKSSGYVTLPVENIPQGFRQICDNIKTFKPEKRLQQRLVLANNAAENSAWYCVDIEYAMQRRNKFETDFGRADIIAISRRRIDGKYRLLMIELKIGTGSFGTNAKFFPTEKLTAAGLLADDRNFGSGIFGHFADFVRYKSDKTYDCGGGYSGRFTKLRGEVVNILQNYSALELLPTDLNSAVEDLKLEDIFDEPTLVFLIYGGTSKRQIERSFRRYIGGRACSDLGGESERSIAKACDENYIAQVFRNDIKCVFRGDNLILNDVDISEAARIF